MISFAAADILIILVYFLTVMFIGFRAASRTADSGEDFLLAGRSLTLPVFIMTLVSTWYGGILGVGEFSYRYGISNWIIQGVPYYVFAAVFAIFMAKKIRASNLYSIPDRLEAAYDRKTAILGSVLTFILMTPAPYILMLSVMLQMIFGWGMGFSMSVTGLVAISYLYWGGFRADIETDIFEFILMFIGFSVILPFSFMKFGGAEFLKANLPPLHLTWHGGNSISFIVVWFFIALWTLVDPAFHQRCYAAKDGQTARKGILISIIFWFVFDFMTAAAGLYARAALPDLQDPVMAFPMLAEAALPPVAKGIFFVGMLATIMSTLNTLAFVSAQTLGRDVYLRLRGPHRLPPESNGTGGRSEKSYTRIGLVITFLISVALAFFLPSVIQLWYTIGTVTVPGLIVPLVASYFPKFKVGRRFAFLSMLFGWISSMGWWAAGRTGDLPGGYPLGIEPIFPGLIVSILIWGIGRWKWIQKGSA